MNDDSLEAIIWNCKAVRVITYVVAALLLGWGAFYVGSTHGEDTVNKVPVMRLHILSTRSNGCYLMVENSKGSRAELEAYGYHCPNVLPQSFITFEVWGNEGDLTTYVYKYVTDDGKEDDQTYREEGYKETLRQ